MDLDKLDDLMHGYLKSWLGMPQSGSFLPVDSGLGMDVKCLASLQGELVPGHCWGSGARGQHSASKGSA
jgi:hypothetical protein